MYFFSATISIYQSKKELQEKQNKLWSGSHDRSQGKYTYRNIYTYFHSHLVEVQLPVNRLSQETGTFYYNMSFIAYL